VPASTHDSYKAAAAEAVYAIYTNRDRQYTPFVYSIRSSSSSSRIPYLYETCPPVRTIRIKQQ
jgi:hypothetical protein